MLSLFGGVRRLLACALVGGCVIGLFGGGAAASAAPGPGWEVTGRFGPTNLPPGGRGILFLYVYNSGGGTVEGPGPTLVDHLPAGLQAEAPEGCSGSTVVTCELPELAPSPKPFLLEIPVDASSEASNVGGPVDLVSVSGGGALEGANVRIPVSFGSGTAGLGFADFDGWLTNSDGSPATQAGSHPYEFTIAFASNSEGLGTGQETPTGGQAHSLNVNFPPGLVGEPGAIPQCTRAQFDGSECPLASKVGEDYASVSGSGLFHFDVFDLVPPPGVAAQFGFDFNGTSVFLDAGLRSGGDNGITIHVNPVAQRSIVFNTTTIWGVPGEHTESESELEASPPKPLLTLPTSCGGEPSFGIEELGTWSDENARAQASFLVHDAAGSPVGFTGCERLVHFQPSLEVAPDTSYSDTPAGLTATLRAPQGLNPEGLAVSNLRNTTVTLPEGLVINPGQANGLQACQPDQEALGLAANGEVNEGPPSCPAASKVGTDEIVTPLLREKLKGSVYVLQHNPPELELLVVASGDGINIKAVGKVALNPLTGRLTTTFENTPDAPFTEFVLSFSGGAQAALVTPPRCGTYETASILTPWSAPLVANALSTSSFAITNGPSGSACAWPMPFAPSMTAGSTTDQAAGYTDFSLLLSRGDGQQRFEGLQFKTPEGLLGMISKVTLCGEPQAAAGACPAASQIGHTVVTAGPGPYPLVVPQPGAPGAPIYLTGPYEGAPYGLSIAVPVIAGPFNLGIEVVRARIEVDPRTSQLTITTNKVPSIIHGIPTDLRVIDAIIDRPGFMFNPTNCSPMSFSGTATSTEGAKATVSSPFQVGSCRSLKFKPNFKVSTSGKTSRLGGASLTVKILYPTTAPGSNQASSQANIARVKVELPKRLPSRLTTLQKACRAAIFDANPADCPAGSVVGHATAVTPVLPGPLSGPAYFVSHGGEAFPSLIVVLQGQGITVDQEGTTFISKKGITTSTFKTVPDVPITSFELALPRGPGSALAANGNLCKGKLAMPTELVAQNGAVIKQSTKINVTNCPKKKTKKNKAKHAKKH